MQRQTTNRGRRVSWAVALSLAALLGARGAQALAIRTLLIGDSITAGTVGAGGTAYADLLAADLASSHELVNLGEGGTSSSSWLPGAPCFPFCSDPGGLFANVLEPELPADVVTVLLGTNDAQGFLLPEGPSTAEAYEANLRELVDALFDGGATDVVLMTPPRLSAAAALDVDDLLGSYADDVREICSELRAVSCGPDLFDLIDPGLDYAPNDNIHPNAAGHAKIASALGDTLLALPEPGTGVLWLVGLGAAFSSGRRSSRRRSLPCRSG